MASTEFLYQTFQLNIRLGEIVNNAPKKYRANYGDSLIQTAIEAYKELEFANSYFITKTSPEEHRTARKEHFKRARALIRHIATVFYIYAELMKKSDSISNAKVTRWEADIGKRCESINKIITSLLKK